MSVLRNALGTRTQGWPRWLVPLIVVGLVLVLVVLPLTASYNGLVDRESEVDRSFADLDAQLQRRYDLIPGLVEAVRAALRQEQEVFGEIAEARTRYAGSSGDERVEAANDVESALGRLLVVVESYPQLQSNQTIRDFQVQLEGTENRIAQARRDYNGVVTDYNRSVRRFPRSIVAGLFGFDRRPLFEAVEEADVPPPIDLEVTQPDGGATPTTVAGAPTTGPTTPST
jgi:LemA protein